MKAIAVLDAAFGDCGKGLMTDYFASQMNNCIVVRHSGGAQAGHTVQTPEGVRHVFGHFGAGTLAGAPTYLSSHFIVNPFTWDKERKSLPASTPLFIDARALLTTPYDMLINQEIERRRGNGRHGSCGLGVNETVVRCNIGFTTRIGYGLFFTKERLKEIKNTYVPQRLKALEIEDPSEEFQNLINNQNLIDNYLNILSNLLSSSGTVIDGGYLRTYDNVVFEGAQGLLLDQKHDFFPHVTPSNTGIANVVNVAAEADINEVDVIYVFRTYMTRHGAGPFPTEVADLRFEDRTNVRNEFQGDLRFGYLDLDLIAEAIKKDLSLAKALKVNPQIALTHVDQWRDDIRYKYRDEIKSAPLGALTKDIESATGVPVGYYSVGPTRDDVINRN